MTPRERVQRALKHEAPDRVPTALWGSYYTLNDDTYFSLLEHLSLPSTVGPFRRFLSRNSNFYDDRILDVLNTDIRYVWSGFTDLGGAPMEGSCTDCWGVKWERRGHSLVSSGPPLDHVTEVSQVDEYSWPEAERYVDTEMITRRIGHLRSVYPDHAVAARAVNSYGPLEQASELRGREQFYVDMIADPDIAKAILSKCSDVIIRAQEIYLEHVGEHVDFFELPGDDYGGMLNLMVSPEMFREFIKPELSRIAGSVKRYDPTMPVAFHSDGAITSIISELVDIGIDILNPLEPLPANDWKKVKAEFGPQLCFMGGIDVREAMRGSLDTIVADVTRCIDTFAGGGGYILAPANHLQMDTPPENIVALYGAAIELGAYN